VRGRTIVGGVIALAVVLAQSLAPASAAAGRRGTFKALTYNVAGLPALISGSQPARNSPLISPKLNDYDLVLLQEDWEDPTKLGIFGYHHLIVSQAKHRYQSDPAPMPLGTGTRRFPKGPALSADGLNRLSRFPFEPLQRHMWEACNGELLLEVAEVAVEELGLTGAVDDAGLGEVIDGGSSDCSAHKGFSVGTTRFANGVAVDIYNLHADAGGGPKDAEARAAGFAQLASFIKRHSVGRAVIVGGDTNLHTERGTAGRPADIAIWKRFQAATAVRDVCAVVSCGRDIGSIDKFAFRSGGGITLKPLLARVEAARFTRSDGAPLSDHDPLTVTFRWESKR
jgi:hypothetical protein